MNKNKVHPERTKKKIKYGQFKRPARNNLNTELKKMIEEFYVGNYLA